MNITKEKDMPLLSRKRVTLEIDHKNKTSPSRAEIKKNVAVQLKCDEELVDIVHIYTEYGRAKSKIIANIYTDKAVIKRFSKGNGKKESKTKKESS